MNPLTLIPKKARQGVYLGFALVIITLAAIVQAFAILGATMPAWLPATLSALMGLGVVFGATAASNVNTTDPSALAAAFAGPLAKIPNTVRQILYVIYSVASAALFVMPAIYPHDAWVPAAQGVLLFLGSVLGFTASANVPPIIVPGEVVPDELDGE